MTDGTTTEHGIQPRPVPLPPLTPVLVATDDEEVEQVLRKARADIARLSLQLRTVSHKADVAERRVFAHAAAPDGTVDLPAARELLRSSLGAHVAARRADLATELEEARGEAARMIASAQQRAEAYVTEAHDGVIATLLHPEQPLSPLPPLPPTVVPNEPSTQAGDQSAPVSDRAAAPPPVPPSPVAPTGAVPDPALEVASILAALQPLLAGVARAGAASAAAVPSTDAVAPPVVKPPRPPLWSRLLYADVLLPLIAVVVVLIILLAWAG